MLNLTQKEVCDLCNNYKWVDFLVTDQCWQKVMNICDEQSDNKGGVYCLNCFIEIANFNEIALHPSDFIDIQIYNPTRKNGQVYSLDLLHFNLKENINTDDR